MTHPADSTAVQPWPSDPDHSEPEPFGPPRAGLRCATSQGFECPCHASKYHAVGERFDGPATRNLDRFVVIIDNRNLDRFVVIIDNRNLLVVATGQIVATPRTQRKSVPYPVGPFCVRQPGEG